VKFLTLLAGVLVRSLLLDPFLLVIPIGAAASAAERRACPERRRRGPAFHPPANPAIERAKSKARAILFPVECATLLPHYRRESGGTMLFAR
jgi:hypothetical protein